jgi:hypothetical protein
MIGEETAIIIMIERDEDVLKIDHIKVEKEVVVMNEHGNEEAGLKDHRKESAMLVGFKIVRVLYPGPDHYHQRERSL